MARRATSKAALKRRKTARTPGRAKAGKRWSQRVTEESDALDLEYGVFA